MHNLGLQAIEVLILFPTALRIEQVCMFLSIHVFRSSQPSHKLNRSYSLIARHLWQEQKTKLQILCRHIHIIIP
jgi:hypothetical protein